MKIAKNGFNIVHTKTHNFVALSKNKFKTEKTLDKKIKQAKRRIFWKELKYTKELVAIASEQKITKKNFCDAHPPLNLHEAKVEADRCYFCYDAPCVTACPTSIDIPKFIRQISTGDIDGSAKTIFDQNILDGMCARLCPTETLCEEACVRETAESDPVKIGLKDMRLIKQYSQNSNFISVKLKQVRRLL